MNCVQAREIKKRGIGALDEALLRGPVRIVRRDRPSCMVLSLAQFEEMQEASAEACAARIKAALRDVRAGRVRAVTAPELLRKRPGRR
jgi:hypothetical protein